MKLRVIKTLLDGMLLAFLAGTLITIFGGYNFEPLPGIKISLHRFSRPVTGFLIVIILRLWVSAPIRFPIGQVIDFWIDRMKIKMKGSMLGADNKIIRPYGVIFRSLGFKIPGTDTDWNCRRIITIITFLMAIILFASPTYRYINHVSVSDLCIFVESMDSAINGGMFENSFHFQMLHTTEEFLSSEEHKISMFASHFRPILFLLLPIYWLVPSPVTLFLIQALIGASSIVPFYLLAQKYLKRDDWAIAATISYCLYPSVLSMSWCFFPGAYSITFLLWAFWFSSQNRYLFVFICMLLTLATKEIMALPVFSFGVYLFLFKRKRLLGFGISILAVMYLLACLYWIIPFFGQGMNYFYTENVYPGFGSSLKEIFLTIIFKPWKVLPYIFSCSTIKYLFSLLFPVAFFPIMGWRVWLLVLPMLAQNILAGQPGMFWCRIPGGLWSAPLVPFTFMAVLTVLHNAKNRFSKSYVNHMLVILIITSLLSLPFANRHEHKPNLTYKKAVNIFKQIAPKKSVVSTNVLSGWGHMRLDYNLYLFPKNIDKADFVFVTKFPVKPKNTGSSRSKKGKEINVREDIFKQDYSKMIETREDLRLVWMEKDNVSGNVISIFKKIGLKIKKMSKDT